MSYELDALGAQRVVSYFERIGQHLKRREQRESFAMYAFGILSEGDRKSVEPIAGRLSTSPHECARVHDHLLRFVGMANWDDMKVRREAAWYAIEALSKQESSRTGSRAARCVIALADARPTAHALRRASPRNSAACEGRSDSSAK